MTANKKGNRGFISKARALLVLLGASAILASLSGESTEYQSNTVVSDTASPSFAADADGFLYSRWLDGTSADCADLVCDGAAELGDETYGSFVIAEKTTTGKTAADVAEIWRRAAGRVGTAFSLSSLGRRALDYTVNDKEMKIADWWRQVYRDTYLGMSDALTDNLLYAGEQSLEKASFVRTADIDFRSSLGNRPWQLGLNVLGSLREKSDEAIAWQLRGYTGEKERKGGNAGLIYRKARGEALLGINAFLDYEHARTGGDFWRWSYGGEIRTEKVDFYANHYLGITDGKRQSDGTYLYTAGGYDVELDVHLMRDISGFLSYYEWEGKYGDEKESGYRYGLKFREIGGSGLNVELILDKPEGKKTHVGGNISYRHEFGLPAKGSQQAEAGFDPRDYFFEPVRREYSQRIRHSLKKTTIQDQVFTLTPVTGGSFQLLEGGQAVTSLVSGDVPYTFEVKDGLMLSTGIGTTVGVKRLNEAYTLTLHADTRVAYRDSGKRLELFTGTVDILRNGAVASNLTVLQAGTRTLTLVGTRLKVALVSNTLRGTLYEGAVHFFHQPGMDLVAEGDKARLRAQMKITIEIDGVLVPTVTVVEVVGGCGEGGKPSAGIERIGGIEVTIGARSRCASEAGAGNLSFNDGYLLPLVASLNQAMTLATLATYVKGGTAPYTYDLVAGGPTGLGIDPNSGVLSVSAPGLLEATGVLLTVRVSDSAQNRVIGIIEVRKQGRISLALPTTQVLRAPHQYEGVLETLWAVNGSGGYRYAISSTSSAVGLTITNNVNVLTLAAVDGPRTLNVIITVRDGKGNEIESPLTVVIDAPLSLTANAARADDWKIPINYVGKVATLVASGGSGKADYRYGIVGTSPHFEVLADMLRIKSGTSSSATLMVTVEVSDKARIPQKAQATVTVTVLAIFGVHLREVTAASYGYTGSVALLSAFGGSGDYSHTILAAGSGAVKAAVVSGNLLTLSLSQAIDSGTTLTITVITRDVGNNELKTTTIPVRGLLPVSLTLPPVTEMTVAHAYRGILLTLEAPVGGDGNYQYDWGNSAFTLRPAAEGKRELLLTRAVSGLSTLTIRVWDSSVRPLTATVVVTVAALEKVSLSLSGLSLTLSHRQTGVLATVTSTGGNAAWHKYVGTGAGITLAVTGGALLLISAVSGPAMLKATVQVTLSDSRVRGADGAEEVLMLTILAPPLVVTVLNVRGAVLSIYTGSVALLSAFGGSGNYSHRVLAAGPTVLAAEVSGAQLTLSLAQALLPRTTLTITVITRDVDDGKLVTTAVPITGVAGSLAVRVLDVRTAPGGYTGSVALLSASGGSGNYSHTVLAAGPVDGVSGVLGARLTLSLAQALPSGTTLTITVITRDVDDNKLVTTTVPITGLAGALSLSSPARVLAAVAADYTGVLATLTATGGDGNYRYTLNNKNFTLLPLGDKMVLSLTNTLSGLVTATVTVAVSDTAVPPATAAVVVSLVVIPKLSIIMSPSNPVKTTFNHRETGLVGYIDVLDPVAGLSFYNHDSKSDQVITDLYGYTTSIDGVSAAKAFLHELKLSVGVDGPATLTVTVQLTLSDSKGRGSGSDAEMVIMLTILPPLSLSSPARELVAAVAGYTGVLATLTATGGNGNYRYTLDNTDFALLSLGDKMVLSLTNTLSGLITATVTVAVSDTAVPPTTATVVVSLIGLAKPAITFGDPIDRFKREFKHRETGYIGPVKPAHNGNYYDERGVKQTINHLYQYTTTSEKIRVPVSVVHYGILYLRATVDGPATLAVTVQVTLSDSRVRGVDGVKEAFTLTILPPPLSLSSPAKELAAVVAGYTGVLATLTATGGNGNYRYTLNNTDFALLSLANQMVLSLTNALSGLITAMVTVEVSDTAVPPATATMIVSLVGMAKPSVSLALDKTTFKHREVAGVIGSVIVVKNGIYYDYEEDGPRRIDYLYQYTTNIDEISLQVAAGYQVVRFIAGVDGPATLEVTYQLTISDSRVRGVDGVKEVFMLTILPPLAVTVLNVRTAPGGYTGSVALLSASGGSGNYSHTVLAAGPTVLAAVVSGATLTLSLAQALPSGTILTITVITRDVDDNQVVTTAVPITGVAALSLSSPAKELAAVVAGYTGVLATLTATGGNGSYRYTLDNTDFALLSLGDKMVLSLTNTLSGLITATVTVEVSDTAVPPATATVVVSLIGLAKPSVTADFVESVFYHRQTGYLGFYDWEHNGNYYDYGRNSIERVDMRLYQFTTSFDGISLSLGLEQGTGLVSVSQVRMYLTTAVDGPATLAVTLTVTLEDSRVRGVDSAEKAFTLEILAPLAVTVLNVTAVEDSYTGSVALLSASGGSGVYSHTVLAAGTTVLAAMVSGQRANLLTLSLAQALPSGTILTITVITRDVDGGTTVTTAVPITGLAAPLAVTALNVRTAPGGYTGSVALLSASGGSGNYSHTVLAAGPTVLATVVSGAGLTLSLAQALPSGTILTITVITRDVDDNKLVTTAVPITGTVLAAPLAVTVLNVRTAPEGYTGSVALLSASGGSGNYSHTVSAVGPVDGVSGVLGARLTLSLAQALSSGTTLTVMVITRDVDDGKVVTTEVPITGLAGSLRLSSPARVLAAVAADYTGVLATLTAAGGNGHYRYTLDNTNFTLLSLGDKMVLSLTNTLSGLMTATVTVAVSDTAVPPATATVVVSVVVIPKLSLEMNPVKTTFNHRETGLVGYINILGQVANLAFYNYDTKSPQSITDFYAYTTSIDGVTAAKAFLHQLSLSVGVDGPATLTVTVYLKLSDSRGRGSGSDAEMVITLTIRAPTTTQNQGHFPMFSDSTFTALSGESESEIRFASDKKRPFLDDEVQSFDRATRKTGRWDETIYDTRRIGDIYLE